MAVWTMAGTQNQHDLLITIPCTFSIILQSEKHTSSKSGPYSEVIFKVLNSNWITRLVVASLLRSD